MSRTEFVCLMIGLTVGWVANWYYFLACRLIRSRSEWYRDRKRRGLSVPPDWVDDDA